MSKTNRFEAEFLMSLAAYLIQQGYEASKITILATYLGQMMLLQKLCQIEGKNKIEFQLYHCEIPQLLSD